MALTFRGGVHPETRKRATREKAAKALPPPPIVVLPMSMHVGAPCQPLVRVSSSVKMGQKIGESSSPVSAPVHASVSGKVIAVEPRLHPNGTKVLSVVIENDGLDTLDESVAPKGSVESLSVPELIAIIREAGIVGLGGAGFPTHLKVTSGQKQVKTLMIDAAECEPYLTANHRTLLERPEEVISGIQILMKLYNTREAIIGIEANKMDAYRVLLRTLPKHGSGIAVKLLKTKYPQGGEKQLTYALAGREIPPGQLPSSVGCVSFNTDTCVSIHRAVTAGMPLVDRVVTVSGSAVANPQNLIVRIGTLFEELIRGAGGYREEPYKIVMGGPMMGIAVQGLDLPVVKGTTALLSFSREKNYFEANPACIRCGRCARVCPMNLLPLTLYECYEKEMFKELENLHITDCIECGSCSYACPGRLHLCQSFKVAKHRLNEYHKRGGE